MIQREKEQRGPVVEICTTLTVWKSVIELTELPLFLMKLIYVRIIIIAILHFSNLYFLSDVKRFNWTKRSGNTIECLSSTAPWRYQKCICLPLLNDGAELNSCCCGFLSTLGS